MGKHWNQPQHVIDGMRERQMGQGNSFYGKHHTEEHKKRISQLMKDRKLTPDWRKRIGESNKGNKKFLGKKHSIDTRKKMSEKAKEMIMNELRHVPRGSEHCNWKGGISETYRKKINDRKWQNRAREIRKRDGYICQQCFESPAYDVHHIIPWRFIHSDDANNLITLCRSCHASTERLLE